MLFMFLSLSLLSVIEGLPLKKMHSSNLMQEIMSSKDDPKILLNIIADADPEKLNEIVVLVRGLISVSEEELAGLISSSGVADAAYDDAVTTHDTAVSTQTSGLTQLATDLALAKAVAQSLHEQSNTASQLIHDQSDAAAQSIHDQGVVSLQGVVDVAKSAMDGASEAKNTANGVLAADTNRLNSEITTLYQVIALIQGVIGINTVAPTMSPPTMSPTSDSYVLYPGWRSDILGYSTQTSPCDVQSFVANLPNGYGYYSDPGVSGGWCRTIAPENIETIRSAYGSNSWTHSATGVTYLTPASKLYFYNNNDNDCSGVPENIVNIDTHNDKHCKQCWDMCADKWSNGADGVALYSPPGSFKITGPARLSLFSACIGNSGPYLAHDYSRIDQLATEDTGCQSLADNPFKLMAAMLRCGSDVSVNYQDELDRRCAAG